MSIKKAKVLKNYFIYWKDDKQVCGYLPLNGKYYSDYPRWEIEIVELWQPSNAKEYYEFLGERKNV